MSADNATEAALECAQWWADQAKRREHSDSYRIQCENNAEHYRKIAKENFSVGDATASTRMSG